MTRRRVQLDGLGAGVRARQRPALARAITAVEENSPGFEQLLSALHADIGKAFRIGITGPPGAGKSTLTEGVVQEYRSQGVTVAVVAVDPSSPFTGGALLGDRVRMESVVLDGGVFIRSMATRGAPGGIATTTREVCDVLDAFGFDRIIVETAGVGQSELAIAGTADVSILVLVPESGDSIQVLKAGVVEIADYFVINKADRPGARALAGSVTEMLTIERNARFLPGAAGDVGRAGEPAGTPPVFLTTATTNEGVAALLRSVEHGMAELAERGELERRRREHLAWHAREVVERALRHRVWLERGANQLFEERVLAVIDGRLSPYELAAEIVTKIGC